MLLSPFISAICIFITFLPSSTAGPQIEDTIAHNSSNTSTIIWTDVGRGILLSMGQVYAVNNLLSSLLITLCVGLYSPLLVVISLQGATLGSLVPLAFQSPEQFSQVYNGLWGYSSILSMACVSSVSLPLSKESIGAGYINILATVFIQNMLGDLMEQVK